MRGSLAAGAVLGLAARFVWAQNPPSCSPSQKCPQDSPCCSQYGECGTGAFCLGGCDPVSSNTLDSCVPAPVCQNQEISFKKNLPNVQSNQKYLGDASKADFVSSGDPQYWNNQKDSSNADNVILTLSENGPNNQAGTLLASTHYMWYGKATATLQTSGGKGVVTAFILLGDSKDEIDFEFVGADLQTAQTNFYSLGVTNYNNGGNASGIADTESNYHTYVIDWNPDTITWSIDDKEVRTLQRSSTWNATANRYDYPQTPARVQLSLWPAGTSKSAPGTVAWAGGLIDWHSQYMSNGYYYAAFSSIKLECYDPPQGANVQGDKSYIFTDSSMTNSTVEVSNKDTVLKSLEGTGTDMDAGSDTSSGSSSATSSPAQVPGLSGVGADGNRGGTGADGSASGTAGAQPTSTGFSQGGGSGGSGSGAPPHPEKVLETSLLAVVVALFALLVL
ncbi:MAG: hypothetical protein Q9227_000067 [Pyrenula ochraceoflavens]